MLRVVYDDAVTVRAGRGPTPRSTAWCAATATLLALSACSGAPSGTASRGTTARSTAWCAATRRKCQERGRGGAPSGTARGGSTAGAYGDGIVVYNAQHENHTGAWVDAFTKETGIKVTLRNGDDLEMSNQLSEEGKNSPADVFLSENSPAMVRIASAGCSPPSIRQPLA